MITLNWYKTTVDKINSIPHSSGVYILSVLLKNQEYAVFYVGKSIDLQNRIKDHFSDNEKNNDLKTFLANDYTFKVSYAESSPQNLDTLEKSLILHYTPRFNNTDGNGDNVESCSLPNVIKW